MTKHTENTYYDYDRQCWIVGGLVKDCNHPASMVCGCYGRKHAGKPIELLSK